MMGGPIQLEGGTTIYEFLSVFRWFMWFITVDIPTDQSDCDNYHYLVINDGFIFTVYQNS